MVNLTSKEVAARINKLSPVGFVLELLNRNSVSRTVENYRDIRERLMSVPTGVTALEEFKDRMEQILCKDETIIVIFRKKKQNGKVGNKKEFRQGYFYYAGDDTKSLSKIYVHWQEEKKYLLANLDSLRISSFILEKQIVECIPNISCMNYSIYESEDKRSLRAEISIYVGCNGND